MYPAQCTSCAVEQSFEWTPGEPCFDCGGACKGAMICPDCLETRKAEDLATLIKTNPKACPTCSYPCPQPQEWQKSRLISRFYGMAKNISWDEKFSKLFVDHKETFPEWTESYAAQIEELKSEFSHLQQLKHFFKPQFYRYGFSNHLLRGLPTTADAFVEHYKNWFSKLDGLNKETVAEFVELSRYHARLHWLG